MKVIIRIIAALAQIIPPPHPTILVPLVDVIVVEAAAVTNGCFFCKNLVN